MGWPCWQAPPVSWFRNSWRFWWWLCLGTLFLWYPSLCWSQICGVQSQSTYRGSPLAPSTGIQSGQCLLASREVLQKNLLIDSSPSPRWVLNFVKIILLVRVWGGFCLFCGFFFSFLFFSKSVFIYIWLLPGWHWHLNVNNLTCPRGSFVVYVTPLNSLQQD